MKDRLFKLLGIEPEEESMVSLLLTQSVFLGIFYGAFDISAHSLFLSSFDEKAMAKAYVLSGFAGIILTTLYTRLQASMKFGIFATTNLLFVTFVTFFLWIAMLLFPGKIVTFAVFVLLGPLNILAMLGFWGTTGRLFSLRQGKRLFGLVDAGLIIGIIISCYAIPVLLEFGFSSHNILIISSVSGIAAVLLQVSVGRKFTFSQEGGKSDTEEKGNMKLFRENKYIRTMGVFVALSVATAFFVQYSFMAVTRAQYPLEEDMARFLGLFTGSMMIFTLLVKLLAFSYIIRNYGLRTCLAISPLLVGGFTLIAILIGMLMGFTPMSSGFLLFFLLMALSRLFSKTLKDSIESPSFKVVYQTVDEKIRYGVQSAVDGTVNEVSALSSGLLLAGLGALSFVKLIHFSWVLFILVALWVIIAFRLYIEYRATIRESLGEAEESSGERMPVIENLVMGEVSAGLRFRTNYYSIAASGTGAAAKHDSRVMEKRIVEWSAQNEDVALLPVLKYISDNPLADESVRQKAVGAFENINSKYTTKLSLNDRLSVAAKLLSGNREPQTAEILRLLRDNRIESKRYAILLIGKFRLTDLAAEVCNCLLIRELRFEAADVLAGFGKAAVEPLSRLFMSNSGNNEVGRLVIILMGKCGGSEAEEFIFSRIWSNSRNVREKAVNTLLNMKFRAKDSEIDKLHHAIGEIMSLITWNLAAKVTLKREEDAELLGIIEKDTESWFNLLFGMLSLAYDRSSIERIKSNIESGTVGSMNYALEMIDMVIDESIKGRLVYLIDTVPDEEKLRNLHQFYPREIPAYESLVEDIINRDYNLIGLWAKAAALRRADFSKGGTVSETVTALLFSPERILLEEAAFALKRSGKEISEDLESRLPADAVAIVKNVLGNDFFFPASVWNKTCFLEDLMPGVRYDELVSLASVTQVTDDPAKLRFETGDEYFAWCSNDGKSVRQVQLVKEKPGEMLGFECRQGSLWYFVPMRFIEQMYLFSPVQSVKIIEELENIFKTNVK